MSKKNRSMIYFAMLLGLLLSFAMAGSVLGSGMQAEGEVEIIYRGLLQVDSFDMSARLDTIPAAETDIHALLEIMDDRDSGLEGPLGPQDEDAALQIAAGPRLIPTPLVSFDGPNNLAGVAPPDPVGDVGPNHYVAMSNLYFAVYDKTGTVLYGPVPNNTLWSGFGGKCESSNAGDPIVLYDQLADRWILTQFTSSSAGAPYYNCVAVSTSGDPTGTYYRYAINNGSAFPDYPKYGVWPDAYYMSTRDFGGSGFDGIGAFALNRADMIAGVPNPRVISFLATPGATPYNVGDGLLPSDLDGDTLPPAGSPNYFMGSMDQGGPYGAPQDALTIWEFQADWDTPANSTFTLVNTVPVAAFDSMFPCSGRDCIPQPDTSNELDILSYRQRPLNRLAYRNFGTHEALVTNQSVEASTNMAGVRWYELRDPGGTPIIYQQSTFAPGTTDGIHRWMGSMAMDRDGNIGLGYSASNSVTYPSVWYTGRLASDPLGTMTQGEASIINGTGSQTGGGSRWGDYTSMNIDPVDDCTFWYVNEYLPATSERGWRLRIGSFKFEECAVGTLTGQVTDDVSGDPIEGVEVTVPGTMATTDASGTYSMVLSDGTYDVTADHADYFSATVMGVVIVTDTITTLDFVLSHDQQAGLSLTPANSTETGLPGETVTHTFTVENTGNYTDSYALNVDGSNWDANVAANTGELGAGESLAVDVPVNIPIEPTGRVIIASDSFTLTAVSDYDGAVSAAALGTTNANVTPGVEFDPASQSDNGLAGEVLTYTYTITNNGDYTDTFALSVASTWTATLSITDTGTLVAGESTELVLTVAIPADAQAGESDMATLTAVSELDGNITATATAESRIIEYLLYLPLIVR